MSLIPKILSNLKNAQLESEEDLTEVYSPGKGRFKKSSIKTELLIKLRELTQLVRTDHWVAAITKISMIEQMLKGMETYFKGGGTETREAQEAPSDRYLIEEGQKLGLTYNGIQGGAGNIPDMLLFTDPETHSTFALPAGSNVQELSNKLFETRKKFTPVKDVYYRGAKKKKVCSAFELLIDNLEKAITTGNIAQAKKSASSIDTLLCQGKFKLDTMKRKATNNLRFVKQLTGGGGLCVGIYGPSSQAVECAFNAIKNWGGTEGDLHAIEEGKFKEGDRFGYFYTTTEKLKSAMTYRTLTLMKEKLPPAYKHLPKGTLLQMASSKCEDKIKNMISEYFLDQLAKHEKGFNPEFYSSGPLDVGNAGSED